MAWDCNDTSSFAMKAYDCSGSELKLQSPSLNNVGIMLPNINFLLYNATFCLIAHRYRKDAFIVTRSGITQMRVNFLLRLGPLKVCFSYYLMEIFHCHHHCWLVQPCNKSLKLCNYKYSIKVFILF